MTTKVFYGVPVSTDEMTLGSLYKLLKSNPRAKLFVNLGDETVNVKCMMNNVTHIIEHVGFFIGFPQPECNEYIFELEHLIVSYQKRLADFELTINYDRNERSECTSIRQVIANYDWKNLDENNHPTWKVTYV